MGIELAKHPLAELLQKCDSIESCFSPGQAWEYSVTLGITLGNESCLQAN
jgi:hypothetical protein